MNDIDTMPHSKCPNMPAVSKVTSVIYFSSLKLPQGL